MSVVPEEFRVFTGGVSFPPVLWTRESLEWMMTVCDWRDCYNIGLFSAFFKVRHPFTKNVYFFCPDCKENWDKLMTEWARKELSKLHRKQTLSRIPSTLNLLQPDGRV